jgi:Fic family protein
LRETPIGISSSSYIPTAIPQLISEMFELLLTKAAAIRDPFEQSLFLMVQLPYLQPFVDVNKRTSRLAANISLIKSNLVPAPRRMERLPRALTRALMPGAAVT